MFGINPAVLIMACVAAVAALGGLTIVAWPVRSEQGIYGKRIAGTMALALALMLALFAWGLARVVPG